MEDADLLTQGDLRNTGNTLAFMDPRIRKAIHIMRTSPQGFGDISIVARSVDLSRSHFFELFRRCTGLSPIVFANVLKWSLHLMRSQIRVGVLLILVMSLDFLLKVTSLGFLNNTRV